MTSPIILSRKKRQSLATKALCMQAKEDLLAHYYHNFDETTKAHFIGVDDPQYNCIIIPEGEWQGFIESEPYKNKKSADEPSYLWDELIQRTAQNALDGTLLGNGGVFASKSAIFCKWQKSRVFYAA